MKKLLDTKIQVTCSQCGKQSTQSLRRLQPKQANPAMCPHCSTQLQEATGVGKAMEGIDKAIARFNR